MLSEILVGLVLLFILLQYLTQKRPQNFPPGPNGIPVLGYLPFLGTPLPPKIAALTKKYGNTFSLFFGNHPIVFLHDIKSIREAFRDDRFTGRPPLKIFSERSFGAPRGIVFGSGRLWMEQRRFALRNLRDFGFGKGSMETLILDEVVDLIAEFKKELNTPVCLEVRFNCAVLNSLWHIVAGERYNHDDPRMKKIIKMLSEEFENISAGGPLFFFEWFTKLFPEISGHNRFMHVINSIYDFIGGYVEEHRKTVNFSSPRDLIDVYLKEIDSTTDKDSSFYKDEGEKNLLVTLLDMFGAGSDTTSTSLSWTILYLITHPEVQHRAQEEIDRVIGPSRLPSLSDRPNMPYMEAVIAEAFRLSSIVTFGGIHSTTEQVEFQGFSLPKDTILLGNFWHLHHDPEYWGDPENFRPARFLTDDGKYKPNEVVQPFGIGKRVCPGESLARDSTFLFLVGMLQQIHFNVDKNGPPPTLKTRDALIVKPYKYNVIMRARHVK